MQHVLFILGGFAVVMGILALLAGAVALLGRVFTARAPAPAALTPVTPAPVAPGIPPHHLAAIAAAVAAITDGRGRVVRVVAPPHQAQAWAQHGRTRHFASHRVRWDWAVPGPPHLDPPRTGTTETKP
ncbi:MAG TPA: OadG family transporter subunit [Azospirillum sp.]|nr:OadG family transporter subunit [Azospirillum sp.]